jgi:hypothetical protein
MRNIIDHPSLYYQDRRYALDDNRVLDEVRMYATDEELEMYATGPGFPGPTNVYIPNWESAGKSILGYSRNAKRFPVARYAQYIQSDKQVGYYLKISFQEAARVPSIDEFTWPDNQERPMNEDGMEAFNFVPFRCQRYNYGFNVGHLTSDQADWPIIDIQTQIKNAQLMTARTVRVLNQSTTTTNWTIAGTGSSGTSSEYDLTVDHTGTATAVSGGFADQGTSTTPFLRILMDKIEVIIAKETLGVVSRPNMMMVINPNVARLLSESPEVHEYIKGSYHVKEELTETMGPNAKYGLPDMVYGMPVVVEDCVKVSSRKISYGGAPTKTFAMPDQQILFLSRIGGLEGVYGGPPFSSVQMFWFQDELTNELFDDPVNRRHRGFCVENTAEAVVSPPSGYLVTSATSVAS